MALAQVVYQISTDKDFATQLQTDPQGALNARGWSLSKEELAFLISTLKGRESTEIRRIVTPLLGFGWR
jgi:hypothetical protein